MPSVSRLLSFAWKVIRDLDSIDPDEREALWLRIEDYMEKSGIGGFTEDVKQLGERIRKVQMQSQYSTLRNLGDWDNIASYWINDFRSKAQARFDSRSDAAVAARLAKAKKTYHMIKNLKLDSRVRDKRKLNQWRALRSQAGRDITYYQAVLDFRQKRYEDLLKHIRARQRAQRTLTSYGGRR